MKTLLGIAPVRLGIVGLLLCTVTCAVNPVTQKQELMLISEQDELQLGRQTDAQIVQEYGLYEDPELTAYLNTFCQRLGKISHRPQLNYQFKILDASVVNAFAVPGGYVYFSRGILASLNNEAELAGVMGHEIGHIAARHSAQQYSKAQFAQMTVGLGAVVAQAAGLPGLAGLAQMGVGMLFMRFSRDNERQADSLGVEYASKLEYDATQLAHFFETLERMNPGSDRSGLPGWFSTHPSPEDRLQAVTSQSRRWQERLGKKEMKVNRDAYLSRIDGLIYGDDPRQGYVAEGIFFHPGLRFQFPVPPKWKLMNTPSQVQMVSEGQDGAILFSLASGMSSREASQTFVKKTRAQVVSSDSIRVSDLPSQRLLSNIQTDKGTLRVTSYFIEKGKNLYVFHGLTSAAQSQKYQGIFDQTMTKFRELTDPKRMNVQPDRVHVRPTKEADTLEAALRSLGVPNDQLEATALLNGRFLKDSIPADTLVKVVGKGR